MKVRSVARLALAGIVVVVIGQTMASAQSSAPVLTKPVNATKEDLSPGRTYGAPYLVVNPDNPKVIFGGFIEQRSRACGVIRSTDAGQTWKIVAPNINLPSYPFCLANNSNIFTAPLAFGRDNSIYLATHGWESPERNKTSVVVAKSTDLGETWTATVAADARPTQGDTQVNNRPVIGLVVDSKSAGSDIVYVGFRQGFPNLTSPNARPQEPTVITSTDGGKTFGPAVSARGTLFDEKSVTDQAISARTTILGTTTTLAAEGSLGATPSQSKNFGATGNGEGLAVDNQGNVYIAWMTASANITPSAPSGLVVSKSTDRAKTWTTTLVQPFQYNNRQNPRLAWSPEGGSNGTLHMVWEGSQNPALNSYADTTYSKSTDANATWSPPKRLADSDPAQLQGNYLPNVVIAPNGRVDVVWWDTRDDVGIRANDVYYTYSTDNGETFAKNIRVTDQSIDRRFGVWGQNFDQNSPPSLASENEYAIFAWDDTRLSRGEDGQINPVDPVAAGEGIGGGVQDIFVAVAQFEPIGGGGVSKTAKYLFAAAIGLLLVGVILMVVVFFSRRSAGGAPTSARPKTSTGVKVKK
ncbi:MAG: hypothetical protein ACRD12_13930 [Acidimicrobiales bacterium]